MFLEISLLIFGGNNSAFTFWFSFSKRIAQSYVALTIYIKGTSLLIATNLGPRFMDFLVRQV